MTASEPILQATDLAVGYGRGRKARAVQKGLHPALYPGTLTCLLGPNGVGKTTLLRTLSGLLPPLAGDLQLLGRPLQAWKPRERAKLIGLTLTDPPASAALTVSQVVALGRYPHTGFWGRLTTHDKEMGAYALRITGMTHKADCPLGELSDGERQKVFLAKALAQEAALLVMDEPTAFLDAPRRTETFALLAHLVRHTGLCVLMATHEVALAREWAQCLWILDSEGLHCGPPAQMEEKMQWTRPEALNLDPSSIVFNSSRSYL